MTGIEERLLELALAFELGRPVDAADVAQTARDAIFALDDLVERLRCAELAADNSEGDLGQKLADALAAAGECRP